MSRYESVAVPFVTVGNRRCLTDEQLCNQPELAAFVGRFPASFERGINAYVWWFIEPEAPDSRSTSSPSDGQPKDTP